MTEALHMKHIVKVYPNGVMANKDVTFLAKTAPESLR